MNWIKKETDKATVKRLIAQYGFSPLVASILTRRGITDGESLFFLHETKAAFLHSPFLFTEMETAVDRINDAIEAGESILVYGDRDVDGITATVIMVSALKERGAKVDWSLPLGDDPYGLTSDKINAFAQAGVSLLITVDCGISNQKEIDAAADLGIDVIVTDHHNPPAELPHALAVLNPKTEDSGYPFKSLAGCGVAFKLMLALQLSQTPFYGTSVTLLNIEASNGSYRFDVCRVRNGVCLERLSEAVVPGVFQLEGSRLNHFLVGSYVTVFDATVQSRYLRSCFGNRIDLHLRDLKPEAALLFPSMADQSLSWIKNRSRLKKYVSPPFTEIDALFRLYVECESARFPAYGQTLNRYIDLVTIGTLADLMPLTQENRLLVTLGMQKMNRKADQAEGFRTPTPWSALLELFRQQHLLETPLTVMDLVFKITPVINASGRLGVPDRAVRFFLEPESPQLAERCRELLSINEERKRIVSALWERYLPVAKKSYDSLQGRFILVAAKDIDRGVTGLLAARMCEYFEAPAMVVRFTEEKVIGSVRSWGGLNVKALLEAFADCFLDFGGHDSAAGFSLLPSRWPGFQTDFLQRVASFPVHTAPPAVEVDAELPAAFMTPQVAQEIFSLEPFGEGFPVCRFVVRRATLEVIQMIGKNSDHLRMTVGVGSYKWVGLFWNMASRVGIDFKEGDTVDLLFHFNQNYFRNQTTAQLQIEDIKLSGDESPFSA